VIHIFNVIDRTEAPVELLLDAISLLAPGGNLVMSAVLPHVTNLQQKFFSKYLPPNGTFEEHASGLVRALATIGLHTSSFSQVPYILEIPPMYRHIPEIPTQLPLETPYQMRKVAILVINDTVTTQRSE
jgi:hypothetical protein